MVLLKNFRNICRFYHLLLLGANEPTDRMISMGRIGLGTHERGGCTVDVFSMGTCINTREKKDCESEYGIEVL